ncbi:phosphatidylglycerophosphatase A [Bacilli bacterium]|nr:phosphatidylglycerophosphatase A [Bacilli bacterium]
MKNPKHENFLANLISLPNIRTIVSFYGGMNIYKWLCFAISSGFGVGYFPFASGTAGSLAILPFAFATAYFYGITGVVVLATLIFIVGTITTVEVLKYTSHDPSLVVIDEVVGQLITFLPVANYLRGNTKDWWIYIVGFFLFRLFDIVKPWPAGKIDRDMLNSWGVMLDDAFAGIYAALVLLLIFAEGGRIK